MMEASTAFEYIVKTPGVCGGRARLDGHRITVKDIAAQVIYHEVKIGELVEGYAASNITHAQIHAALAYYYDHREEIDTEIAEEERLYQEASRGREASITEKLTNESHVTTTKAAIMLGLKDAASVRALISRRELAAVKWPPDQTHRATWLVERQSIEALIEKREKQAREGGPGRPPNIPE